MRRLKSYLFVLVFILLPRSGIVGQEISIKAINPKSYSFTLYIDTDRFNSIAKLYYLPHKTADDKWGENIFGSLFTSNWPFTTDGELDASGFYIINGNTFKESEYLVPIDLSNICIPTDTLITGFLKYGTNIYVQAKRDESYEFFDIRCCIEYIDDKIFIILDLDKLDSEVPMKKYLDEVFGGSF